MALHRVAARPAGDGADPSGLWFIDDPAGSRFTQIDLAAARHGGSGMTGWRLDGGTLSGAVRET